MMCHKGILTRTGGLRLSLDTFLVPENATIPSDNAHDIEKKDASLPMCNIANGALDMRRTRPKIHAQTYRLYLTKPSPYVNLFFGKNTACPIQSTCVIPMM